MKKLTTIILITLTALLLSSCVINLETITHTMYFQNDTSTKYIYDWYLKDTNGNKYAISEDYCVVPFNSSSSLSGLYTKEYQIWFCIYQSPSADYYTHSAGFVKLASDTTFRLSREGFYTGAPRAAGKLTDENSEPKLILTDSNGNQYKLVTEIIYK